MTSNAAFLFDQQEYAVTVTIQAYLMNALYMAGAFTLTPQTLT
jgi:hypothetical protein